MVDSHPAQPLVTDRVRWAEAVGILLLVLLVARLGRQVPLPGTDPAVLEQLRASAGSGPSALARISLFALGLAPFLNAWLVVEIFRGSRSEADVARWRRGLTAIFALVQGWGVAGALEGVRGLVPEPGLDFRISTALALAASTMLLMWLGEQITRLGICDGIWLLFAADIVAGLPASAAMLYELSRIGQGISPQGLAALLVLLVATVALIVVIEGAGREVQVSRSDGSKQTLFFKLDRATIVPAYVASWAMAVPNVLAWLFSSGAGDYGIARGHPVFLIVYALFIAIATYMVTAARLSPRRIAAELARRAATIEGVAPARTASWLDAVFTRTTAITAAYLVAICLLPEVLIAYFNVPFYVGGPTLLIVVIVALDMLSRASGTSRRDAADEL